MDDIYKNIEEYSQNKKGKMLIVFDQMIAGVISNETLNLIVTELSIRGKNYIFLLFLSHNLILLFRKILD